VDAQGIVTHQWEYLERSEQPTEVLRMILEARCRPQLRQLYPYLSLDRLHFSRVTEYPYTHDAPWLKPLGNDRYGVYDPQNRLICESTLGVALDVVIERLPPACGPAQLGAAQEEDDDEADK